MKEIKVATLTKEEKALFKEALKARGEMELTILRAQIIQEAFWRQLRDNHNLSFDTKHFIKSNAIYKYEL